MGAGDGRFPVETGFLARSFRDWKTEGQPARRVARLFAVWEGALRFMGGCLGAELALDDRFGFAAEWFRGSLALEEMHRLIWATLRREHPPMGSGVFPLLKRMAEEPGIADHLRAMGEGWERWARGGADPDALHGALAPRMDVLASRLGGLDLLGLMTVNASRPLGVFVEWTGEASLPPGGPPSPRVLRTDRPGAPGGTYLLDGDRPLALMDPWVLAADCPICRERHFFLLERPDDASSRYAAIGSPCAVVFPLGRQALMDRLAGRGATAQGGEGDGARSDPPPSVGMRVSRRLRRLEPTVRSLAWSGDGRCLAAGGSDGAIRLDDYESGEPSALLKHHARSVTALAWSPDERSLASGGAEGSIAVWDISRCSVRASVEGAFLYPVTALAWSPSGALCASAHAEPRVWVWETNRWKTQGWLEGHAGGAACLAWTDHRHLAAGGMDGRVRLWDAFTRKTVWEGHGHIGGIRGLLVSPDRRWLATAGADGMLRVWSSSSGEMIREARAHAGPVSALTASHEGAFLASRGDDGRVRIWDARRWEVLAMLEERPAPAAPMHFHPFLPLLAAADPWEKRVQVYRIESDPPEERTDWGAFRKAVC